jgi:hypothetical protein
MQAVSTSPWKIEASQATFHAAGWQGEISLDFPERGLSLRHQRQPALAGLLAVDFPPPHLPLSKDCYSRQSDLVVVFPQRDQRRFTVQLDYRLLETTAVDCWIELWVSVQTYLLDSQPSVQVGCGLELSSLRWWDPDLQEVAVNRQEIPPGRPIAMVTGRSIDQQWEVAWMLHPRDQGDARWSVGEAIAPCSTQLFGHFMEKGVIRRGRMRCLVSSQPLTEARLAADYQRFADSPLPLTA